MRSKVFPEGSEGEVQGSGSCLERGNLVVICGFLTSKPSHSNKGLGIEMYISFLINVYLQISMTEPQL